MNESHAVLPADGHGLSMKHCNSAAVHSGDLLIVSGGVGSRDDGTPEPDFGRQVELAYENVRATLDAEGYTFDDVVDVTTFHTDLESQFGAVMAVKQKFFPQKPYPNWTAVRVTSLSGFDFEIKVIARIP